MVSSPIRAYHHAKSTLFALTDRRALVLTGSRMRTFPLELIEFIETTLFSLVNRITTDTTDGVAQATQIVAVLLGFAEKNPGMTRVLIGDALVNEDERLQTRMNQLYDRIEASLRQSLKIAQAGGSWPGDAVADANALLAFVVGRWMLFAKSGFKRLPQEAWDAQRKYLFA